MTALVDTTIWSLALRRRPGDLSAVERRLVSAWKSLVRANEAALVGPVRQEILSGVRDASQFRALQERLAAFPYVEIAPDDYDRAASFFNACRARGVVGTPIDMLLCAIASRLGMPVFTTDRDFLSYSRHVPVRLHLRALLQREA